MAREYNNKSFYYSCRTEVFGFDFWIIGNQKSPGGNQTEISRGDYSLGSIIVKDTSATYQIHVLLGLLITCTIDGMPTESLVIMKMVL